jgi:6-pyruvoyltetrahydropterin/6-carboxytetrahydropterin synthase
MHGHSFQVTLVWEGEIDPKVGWVVDYHAVEKQWQSLKEQLDHRILNEVPGLENPTSEHLAHWIFQRAKAWLPQLVQVIVSETPNTECRYPV